MENYQEIKRLFEKFADVKEIDEYIDLFEKLRRYYYIRNREKLKEVIEKIKEKYPAESQIWNATHPKEAKNWKQVYESTERLMFAIGAKLIVTKVEDYVLKLNQEETAFVDFESKLVEER